jgi:hypothetical protein
LDWIFNSYPSHSLTHSLTRLPTIHLTQIIERIQQDDATLLSVDLSHRVVNVVTLSAALRNNQYIQELILQGVDLRTSIDALCLALRTGKQKPRFSRLDLSFTNIEVSGLVRVFELIMAITTLVDVVVVGNPGADGPMAMRLKRLLDLNRSKMAQQPSSPSQSAPTSPTYATSPSTPTSASSSGSIAERKVAFTSSLSSSALQNKESPIPCATTNSLPPSTSSITAALSSAAATISPPASRNSSLTHDQQQQQQQQAQQLMSAQLQSLAASQQSTMSPNSSKANISRLNLSEVSSVGRVSRKKSEDSESKKVGKKKKSSSKSPALEPISLDSPSSIHDVLQVPLLKKRITVLEQSERDLISRVQELEREVAMLRTAAADSPLSSASMGSSVSESRTSSKKFTSLMLKKSTQDKRIAISFRNTMVTERLATTGGSNAGVFSCYVDGVYYLSLHALPTTRLLMLILGVVIVIVIVIVVVVGQRQLSLGLVVYRLVVCNEGIGH